MLTDNKVQNFKFVPSKPKKMHIAEEDNNFIPFLQQR